MTASVWTCRLCRFLCSQRRVFSSRINSTQLSNGIESILWAMLTWRPLHEISQKFTTVQQHVIDIIFPWFDRRFLQGRDCWLIWSAEAPKVGHSPWKQDSCYSLPIFSLRHVLHHPYPRAFCTLPSFARIKGHDSGPSSSTIHIHDRME